METTVIMFMTSKMMMLTSWATMMPMNRKEKILDSRRPEIIQRDGNVGNGNNSDNVYDVKDDNADEWKRENTLRRRPAAIIFLNILKYSKIF